MAQIVNITKAKEKTEESLITIKSPIFLLFAEYLGFVSGVVTWAEDCVNGKKLSEYQKKVIDTDALCLKKQMLNEFSKEDILSWYQSFYDVILGDYDKNLEKNFK